MSNIRTMVSPQDGRVTTVLEIPDEVFSEKILGDGLAVVPTSDRIVSPVDGEIIQVAETGHAFCIRSDDGVEILIHIGVDTVGLRGKGFVSFVGVGKKVKAGEPIGTADLEMIKENGYPTHTAVLITNMGVIDTMEVHPGQAEAGKTVALSYTLK